MTLSPTLQQASRRITNALFVSQSFFAAAMIASFTLTSIIAADLSGNDKLAGLPSTMSLLGRAAIAYPLGWLMDRLGRRITLAGGYFFGSLGAAISILAIIWQSFPLFMFGSLIFGMGRASSDQSRYIAAEVQTSNNRAKAIGFVVFAGTIGSVLGPRLVAPASELAKNMGLDAYAGPSLIGMALTFVAGLVVLIFIYPDPLHIGRAWREQEDEAALTAGTPTVIRATRPLFTIFRQPMVQIAILSMIIGQLVMTLLMTITPLHMDHNSHSVDNIGWVLMAHTLGMFGFASVTGWLIDRIGALRVIALGGLILVVSCILTPISSGLWPLIIALFLLGLGWNFCFVAGSALLTASLSLEEKARTQGATEALSALASGVGSASSGFFYAWGGMVVVAAFGLALTLAILAQLALQPRRQTTIAQSGAD
jgi:MFS family permease